MWCPSHLRDKDPPPPDAKQKYEKARQQAGWRDEYMDLDKQVDKLAGDALDTARGLHEAISARETALARA